MNKKHTLKILSIVGTRPELIRLSRILAKMDEYFNHIFVFTRQSFSYELSTIFLQELGFRKPDYELSVKSKTLGGQIARILEQSEEIMLKEKPDALMILGDTNSALSAIIARRMHIPIFHLEAGNRSFDWHVPEEVNRRIIDHISNYNLAYTEHARSYLVSEGIPRQSTFVIGSPLTEVIDFYADRITASSILKKLSLTPNNYFIASIHREENVDSPNTLKKIIEALNAVTYKYKKECIVSLHPRTKDRLEKLSIKISKQIRLCKPFGYFDYLFLQKNACCTLSDSGTIQEESAIIGFPAVQMRASTERPEAFDAGSIILAGTDPQSIVQSVDMAILEWKKGVPSRSLYYTDTNVSEKVVKLIGGLTSIATYGKKE
jgi:UDP-N-acetylglucosamine 2-epimerase (non-hydrolysing)